MITVGTDIIDRARVVRAEKALLQRVLTPDEYAYCVRHTDPYPHMAARFAAKEAVFKALRPCRISGISWKDIEITHDTHDAPCVVLHGNARRITDEKGLLAISLSLSHIHDYATATAICEWKE